MSEMREGGLGFTHSSRETMREAVERIAKVHGLEGECLEAYDRYIAAGDEEGDAAWCALYDWDVLDFYPDNTESETL